MSKFLLPLMLVVISSTTCLAQQLIRGVIVNRSEVPISGVRVSEEGTSNVSYSDEEGIFNLFYFSNKNKLVFDHIDFYSVKVSIDSQKQIRVYLEKSMNGNLYNLGHLAGYTDFVMKNPNKRLENMPYFLGEGDVNRQLQMLPGVEHGNEGYSNLLIRGGNVDENLMLYNGTPVYNYNHLFGLSSLFHNNSVDNVHLHKGIMSAQYGGRTSSMISIETPKESEYSGMSGEAEISTLSAGLYLRFMERNKSYFTLSARRSWIDLLLPVETRQNDLNAHFGDLQLNWGKYQKDGNLLELSLLYTSDYYLIGSTFPPDSGSLESIRYTQLYKWSNFLSSAKYHQNFSKQLKAEHSIHFTSFGSTVFEKIQILNAQGATGVPTASAEDKRGIREYIAQSNWNYLRDNSSSVSFGIQAHVKTYRPGYTVYESVNYPNSSDRLETYGNKRFSPSLEGVLFGQYTKRINPDLNMEIGLRTTVYHYKELTGVYPEPRIHFSYSLDSKSVLKLGFNTHHQFTKLINTGGTENPTNFWVPATALVKPYQSHILNMSFERKLAKQYSMAVDAYYKQMSNIHVVNNFYEAFDAETDWQNQIIQGTGSAYGLEVMFQKNAGIVNGWVSYVYSKSDRLFDELSEDAFPFDFDRRHMVKAYVNVDAGKYWDFGANYVIGSGQLFNIPDGKFADLEGNLQLEYSSFNNFQSPMYHRLDLSLSKLTERSALDQKWKFYVYNFYGAKNALFLTPSFEGAGFTNIQIERGYWYFVPGVAYSVVF